jgi:hypothetical protein
MQNLTHIELPGLSNWHPMSIHSLVHAFSMLHKLKSVKLLDFDQLYQRSLLSAISVATELTELQLSCKYTLQGADSLDAASVLPLAISYWKRMTSTCLLCLPRGVAAAGQYVSLLTYTEPMRSVFTI